MDDAGYQAELGQLREEIRQLRGDLAPPDLTTSIQDRMGFAPGPSRVLSSLLAHKVRSGEQWNRLSPGAPPPKLGIVGVYIHDLRRAGVDIKTITGHGYSLPDEERSRIADFLSV